MLKLVLLLATITLGLLTRLYQPLERFQYNHDADLSAWIVKDMLIDGHPRLIGQLTSAPGIFIGPLFYYSLTPFYLLSGMSPVGIIGFSLIISFIALFSVAWVFNRLWGFYTAVMGLLIYALSFNISQTEREVVPTTPVFLWTVWFLYAAHGLWRGRKSSLLILATLGGLVWNIHLALGLLFPLVLVIYWKQSSKFAIRDFLLPTLVFVVLSSPLLLFEGRHDFIQVRSFMNSFASRAQIARSYTQKTAQVWLYSARNTNNIFWDKPAGISIYLLPIILLLGFVILYYRGHITPRLLIFIAGWFGLTIVFFVLHPINLSEYYLNGLNIIWIAIAALSLARLNRKIAWAIVALFIAHNIYRLISSPVNRSGYLYRQAIVKTIRADATSHNFPCVAVSYIVTPGNDLGYRYLFWLAGQKLAPPSSLAPVYTIVFPHSLVGRLDKTFGALGLIWPGYSRYTPQSIAESCSGSDSNLTDPMFGFTK